MILFLIAQIVVTAYRLQFFAASTPDPLTAPPLAETPDIPVTMTCNQVPPAQPPPIVVDPMSFAWVDPVNPLRDCVTNQGPFLAANLPAAGTPTVAGYVVTVTAVANGVMSARTLASNRFSTTLTPPPPPPPPAFMVGASVQATEIANVRATPAGSLLGTQALGSPGVIIAGPTLAVFNGVSVTWWNINFTTGVDGWVGEDVLVAVPTGHPVPTGVGVRR